MGDAPVGDQVRTVTALRDAYPPPTLRSSRKELDHLDHHCARFIGLSPFCVLATQRADGPDLSPRGGEPGFVRVDGPGRLLLPDRPGNYRLDSLTNLMGSARVSLLFFVPGIDETLRVYGSATVISLDDDLRRRLGLDGKGRTLLDIGVDRAFFHCAKAAMRSGLWDPERRVERSSFPTMGQLMSEHARLDGPAESQAEMLARYEPTL